MFDCGRGTELDDKDDMPTDAMSFARDGAPPSVSDIGFGSGEKRKLEMLLMNCDGRNERSILPNGLRFESGFGIKVEPTVCGIKLGFRGLNGRIGDSLSLFRSCRMRLVPLLLDGSVVGEEIWFLSAGVRYVPELLRPPDDPDDFVSRGQSVLFDNPSS